MIIGMELKTGKGSGMLECRRPVRTPKPDIPKLGEKHG